MTDKQREKAKPQEGGRDVHTNSPHGMRIRTSWDYNSGPSWSGSVKDGHLCSVLSAPTYNLGGLRGGSVFLSRPRRIQKLSLLQNTPAIQQCSSPLHSQTTSKQ